jgi:proline dehydrogenase
MFRVHALRAHHHALPRTTHPIRQLWRPNSRLNSTISRPGGLSRPLFRYSVYAAGLGVGLAAGSLSVALWRESQLVKQAELDKTRPPTPLRELVRSYVVYSLCSFPTLVDWSPHILETLMKIPIISNITEAVVRVTFFDQVWTQPGTFTEFDLRDTQFVGADHADECIPLLKRLRAENKGCLFAYSVEVDETADSSGSHKQTHGDAIPPHKLAVQEMLASIDVAAKFEDSLGETDALSRKTWIAVKMVSPP